LIGAWEQRAGISSVSSFAHLGGAGVGMVAWLIWRRHKDGEEEQTNERAARS
jgi:membrane associated rhomboid family serine protease